MYPGSSSNLSASVSSSSLSSKQIVEPSPKNGTFVSSFCFFVGSLIGFFLFICLWIWKFILIFFYLLDLHLLCTSSFVSWYMISYFELLKILEAFFPISFPLSSHDQHNLISLLLSNPILFYHLQSFLQLLRSVFKRRRRL